LNKVKNFFRSAWNDAALLVNHNKALIVVVLIILCIVDPLVQEWNASRIRLDHKLIYGDSRLRIVEGEKPIASNIDHYWIERNSKAFKGKFLAFDTDTLPEERFISLKYVLPVERDARYKIFIAGSAPGPLTQMYISDESPYTVIIDGQTVVDMYEEKKKDFLVETFGNKFYLWHSYAVGMVFSKIGEFFLTQGNHEIEFKINQRNLRQNRYVFIIDAIFLVPENWKFQGEFMTFPDDLLAY